MANIRSLPLELVLQFFVHLSSATYQDWLHAVEKGTKPDTGPYVWIVVTHVCRYWRDLALASPTLWRNIAILSSNEAILEFLKRSKTLTVSLTCAALDPPYFNSLPHRTRALYELVEQPDVPGRVETLTLSNLTLSWGWRESCCTAESAILLKPRTLYLVGETRHAPKLDQMTNSQLNGLEELSIQTSVTMLSPTTILVPTLKSLTLATTYLHENHYHRLHMREVLLALQTTPLLETLGLHVTSRTPDCGMTFDYHDDDPPVKLSRLQNLFLTGDTHACLFVMEHIDAPANLRVVFDISPVAEEVFHRHPNSFRYALPGRNTPVVHRLTKFAPFDTCLLSSGHEAGQSVFRLRGWPSILPLGQRLDCDWPQPPSLEFRVFTRATNEAEVQRVWASLPLANMSTLGISPTLHDDTAMLDYMYLAVSKSTVRLLRLGWMAGPLAVMLLDLCVSAEEILLHNIYFRPAAPITKMSKKWRARIRAFEALCAAGVDKTGGGTSALYNVLLRRRETATAIKKLSIYSCKNLTSADVDRFRTVVDSVIWDGVER